MCVLSQWLVWHIKESAKSQLAWRFTVQVFFNVLTGAGQGRAVSRPRQGTHRQIAPGSVSAPSRRIPQE